VNVGLNLGSSSKEGFYPRPKLVRQKYIELDRLAGFAYDNLDQASIITGRRTPNSSTAKYSRHSPPNPRP